MSCGSSMLAMIFSWPPQRAQPSICTPNTRFSRRAQLIATCRGGDGLTASAPDTGGVAAPRPRCAGVRTHWPDLPINWPTSHLRATDRLRVANARSSEQAPVEFAKRLGVPVVQASHCGEIKGDLYLFPGVNWHVPYHTSFVGRTQIVDANGQVVAFREMRRTRRDQCCH